MADVYDALAAAKTILATLNPSPQPAPNAVYIYPDEFAVNTTAAGAIAAGADTVTPAAEGEKSGMAGIFVGTTLRIGSGGDEETVTVTAVTATAFTATFTNSHDAGAAIRHSIDRETVPFITIEQVVNTAGRWGHATPHKGTHVWEMDIRIYLRRGQQQNDGDFAIVAWRARPYLLALTTLLYANSSLNGTADLIGGGRLRQSSFGDMAEYRVGHMAIGADSQPYWGIGLRVPVLQSHSQPVSR